MCIEVGATLVFSGLYEVKQIKTLTKNWKSSKHFTIPINSDLCPITKQEIIIQINRVYMSNNINSRKLVT